MPSIKTLTPILGGRYYHIFNRGTNRQLIFYKEENYSYFLRLLNKYLSDYVHFLSFCLLPNHFHLVVKVRDEIYVENKKNRSLSTKNSGNGSLVRHTDEGEIGKLTVRQLKRLFITYAMAINKQENRVGNLFDPKYKRLEITKQDYLEYVIFYTNYNSEKHGLIDDYKNYKFSSFQAIKGKSKTSIDREFVLNIYGGRDEFLNYHNVVHDDREAIILE